MVKLIGKSTKEIANEERESKLVNIAKEVFGEKFNVLNNFSYTIHLQEKDKFNIPIVVGIFPNQNKIRVMYSNYLKDAINLAKAYETSGELEFTVKKDYDE